MKIVEKPDFQVFASEAKSGEVLSFPDVPRGWGISLDQTQGKPPLEWMNGAFKRVDLNNLYLLQQGLPAWNAAIKYPVNSIIKHLDKVYLCVKENENSAPTGNSSDWVLYVKNATTTQKGIVQLTNNIDDSEDRAITPRAVNIIKKKADKIPEPIKDNFIVGNDATGYKLMTTEQVKELLAVPTAAKLYSETGQNTDGSMTQKAVTGELAKMLNLSSVKTIELIKDAIYTNESDKVIVLTIAMPYTDGSHEYNTGLELLIDQKWVNVAWRGKGNYTSTIVIVPKMKYRWAGLTQPHTVLEYL